MTAREITQYSSDGAAQTVTALSSQRLISRLNKAQGYDLRNLMTFSPDYVVRADLFLSESTNSLVICDN